MNSWSKHSCVAMIERSRRVAAAILCVLAAAGCDDPGVGPEPRATGQLLVVSGQPDAAQSDWINLKKDIYRMNADGTGLVNLTGLPSYVYASMSLSPDGRRIAFASDRSGCLSIWMMNVDGTGLQQLTTYEERCNRMPRWSPDGTRIAFSTTREGRWSVYVMNADGSNPHNVSSPLDQVEGSINWPVGWSPDGRVVISHYVNGIDQAYTVNRDGTGLALFGQPGDHSPAWSPDGSKVAFMRVTDGRTSLFVMNSNGSNVRRLTNQAGNDQLAVARNVWESDLSPWSPDGTRIAFENFIDFTAAVEVIRADGSGHLRLTDRRAGTRFNGWSPDGRITFASDDTGSMDVYLINADGSGLVNLTRSTSHESFALWVPER